MIEQDTRPTETLKFQEDTFTDAFALLSQEIRKLNEQGKEVVAQKVEQDEETEKYVVEIKVVVEKEIESRKM
ncbi:MAG: hypothetical protein K6G37_00405 [Bacilli bacterium]|nr:hypothetical protein [Bacilli bacterium]